MVRPNEIGSSDYLKSEAKAKDCKIYEYELEAQFRCNGSEAFVNRINNTLGIRRTANVIWDQREEFDFRIFETPEKLEKAIKLKFSQGFTSRLTAGFCWDWSPPNSDGTLKDDVVIGDFRRPWDAKPEARRLAPGIPKAELWAYDPNGINQIGCVYTAQGFEFDYVGVIVGLDLAYDFDDQQWVGHPENSADRMVRRSKDKYLDLIKNTYRVLFTRGLKGCYVHFVDKDTERFLKSRIEASGPVTARELERESIDWDNFLSDLVSDENLAQDRKYKDHVPVFSLEAVATTFGGESIVEGLGWKKIDYPTRGDHHYFIAKVVGRSMEPTIMDGSYCLFRKHSAGSRSGSIVIAASHRVSDPENAQRFTIKRYSSEKEFFDDGTWVHKKIVLSPDNKEFDPIILEGVDPADFCVVAEFIKCIS